jgi:hypothetical protein
MFSGDFDCSAGEFIDFFGGADFFGFGDGFGCFFSFCVAFCELRLAVREEGGGGTVQEEVRKKGRWEDWRMDGVELKGWEGD